MRLQKKILKSLKIFGFLALAIFIVFVSVNLIDVPLNPQIPALVEKLMQPVKQKDNAYFALIKLITDKDTETLLTHRREGKKCRRGQANSLACLEKSQPDPRLIQRYQGVITLPDYQEPVPSQIASGQDPVKINKQYLRYIRYNWVTGRQELAMTELAQVQQFWHRVTEANTDLITKAIAYTVLKDNFQLLSFMLTHCKDCRRHEAALTTLLTPFTLKTFSLKTGFQRVIADQVEALAQFGTVQTENMRDRLIQFLYQKNYSTNSMYRIFKRYASMSSVSPDKYPAEKEKYRNEIANILQPDIKERFFHFVDTWIRAIARPSFSFYEQGVNLEHLRRLLAIKQMLVNKNISTEQIPAFISQLEPEKYADLVNKKLPTYNDAENSLGYKISGFELNSVKLKL